MGLAASELDEAKVQYFKATAIGFGVDAVCNRYFEVIDSIMDGNYSKELLYDSEAAPLYDCLKNKIGKQRIYPCQEAASLEVLGTNIIHSLMDLFIGSFPEQASGHRTSSKYHEKLKSLLSSNYRRAYKQAVRHHPDWKGYYQLRLLTDYICGMTDTFALNLCRRLHNEP